MVAIKQRLDVLIAPYDGAIIYFIQVLHLPKKVSITSYLHVLKFHVFICLVSSYVGMSPERFDLLVDLMQEQSKRFEIRIQDRSRLLQLKIGRKQHRSFLEFCLFSGVSSSDLFISFWRHSICSILSLSESSVVIFIRWMEDFML